MNNRYILTPFLLLSALLVSVNATAQVLVKGSVFGGGNEGNVGGSVEVNITGGTVNQDVYGGGAKAHTNENNWNDEGSTLGDTYYEVTLEAGSSLEGYYTRVGDTYTAETGTTVGGGTFYRKVNTLVNLTGGTIKGDAYGGGLGYNDEVDDEKDQPANVYGDVTVTVDGTKMMTGYDTSGETPVVNAGRVFGCNNVLGTPKGHVKVLVKKTGDVTELVPAQTIDVAAVFGGGNKADYDPYDKADFTEFTEVEINKPSGEGQRVIVGNVYGGGNEAGINADTQVKIISGDVKTGVYGGCNTSGTVINDATVTLTGGTIGTDASHTANVHGGGYGENTYVKGNVKVKVGEMNVATDLTIWGDVYGGSALGHVNAYHVDADADEADRKYSTDKTTTVSLYAGTIHGNAYGGGLGAADKPATVGGAVLVELNGTTTKNASDEDVKTTVDNDKKGCVVNQIFGANNVNGTPKDAVTVHVYKTQNIAKNTILSKFPRHPIMGESDTEVTKETTKEYLLRLIQAAYTDGDPSKDLKDTRITSSVLTTAKGVHDKTEPAPATEEELKAEIEKVQQELNKLYDVKAVYGGGNEAAYKPTSTSGTTRVIIEGCDETSIETVYGGGNAATVPATDVTVYSSYEINELFGGGNGKDNLANGDPNPGADVGFADEGYTGMAITKLMGGTIHYVFGGSNTKGNVRGRTSVTMPESDGACDLRVNYIYGAGKEAEQDGPVMLVIGCIDHLDYVYGGAKDANIKGGIDLYITSGHFKGVFGGNDTSGSIQGPITLTIEETGCEPLEIEELYLGGNQAAYSVYGYKEVAGKLVARSSMNDDTAVNPPADDPGSDKITETQLYPDPVLNVVSCTSIGRVYGGGLGENAVMYGSPTVNLNMIPGTYATGIDRDGDDVADGNAQALGAIGNVFGGGSEANVVGNTTVNVCTETKVTVKTNNGAFIPDANLVESDVKGAYITGSVYGGGQKANVTGNTQVNIMAEKAVSGDTYNPVTLAAGAVGVSIAENVFGAGMGVDSDVNSALVTGNTTIMMAGGSVTKSVYGGGQLSQVGGNTNVTISGGTIGKDREETATPGEYTYYGGAEYGNVYGAGLGSELGVGFGQVKGNTNITIQNILADEAWVTAHSDAGKSEGDELSSPTIYHNIYGGGALASVGTYTYNASNEITGHTDDTGKATITITGGTIGTDGHNNGMVFGSSRGDIDDPASIHEKLAWVYDTDVRIGVENDETDGPTLHGSLYGGGENGHVYNDASVIMYSGTVGNPSEFYAYRGNVYGAGCGTDMYYSTAEETHDGNGDKYNPNAGIVRHNTTIIIYGGNVANNVYGAGSMGKVLGSTSVTINTDGAIGVDGLHDDGNVYGAARGELDLTGKIPGGDNANDYSSVINSSVTLTKGTVKGSLYGGGKAGVVNGSVTVQLNGGTVLHDAYGGGALAQTNTSYASGDTPATIVNLNGATVTGNVYGGGLGQLAVAGSAGTPAVYYSDVAEYNADKGTSLTSEEFALLTEEQKTKTPAVAAVAAVSAVEADVDGPVTVTVSSGTAANVFGCNNVNGMPKSTVAVVIGAKSDGGVLSGTGTVSGSVYGGGNQAACTGSPTVTLYGGTVSTNVYGGGLGSTAKTGSATVVMEGGTVGNDVFGGGSQADVTGNVSVTISGGTVTNDVYGGGALANTNTDNWNSATGTTTYKVQVYGLTAGTSSVDDFYTKAPDTYEKATGTAEEGVTYYNKVDSYTSVTVAVGADVTGYYTKPADTYVLVTPGTKAAEGVTYYVGGTTYSIVSAETLTPGTTDVSSYYKKIPGAYSPASGKAVAGTKYYEEKTLTGSWVEGKNDPSTGTTYKTTVDLIGGIVGNAYGGGLGNADTPAMVYGDVTVTVGDGSNDEVGATAFTRRINTAATAATGSNVYETGHLFGANNINGTPTGDVTVNVYKTARTDGGAHQTGKENSANYEIQGVYGGGNLADYMPITGKKSKVNIDGCNEVSIEFVYGGGNSAAVPGTNVDIRGCYEIGYAFGGGNGNDKILGPDGNTWYFHGADVNGDTHIDLHGGTIHWAFGGSNRLGDCIGDIYYRTLSDNPSCPLRITTLYGAGQNADLDGSLDLVIKCPSNALDSYIENVYGGSLNAQISGGVTLTIIGGIYENVYGGNDQSGSIGGPIKINIQETSDCQPIIIKRLYGGGDQAPYPRFEGSGGSITINAKSFTRIGQVFGGGHQADVYGKTEININTVEGEWAGKDEFANLPIKETDYAKTDEQLIAENAGDIPNIKDVSVLTVRDGEDKVKSKSIQFKVKEEIGTIGDVFGGGDQGMIHGNAVVNIGTVKKVPINTYDGNNVYVSSSDKDVLGAHITGDVYGGGNKADVTGSTSVNYGTGNYTEVANFEGLSVGGSIYGGGCEADVKTNTYVTMAGGYVFDGVYGGGLQGSVGTITERDALPSGHPDHDGCLRGKPKTFTPGTGKCTVVVSGGQVGPVEVAKADGGMKNTAGYYYENGVVKTGGENTPVDVGFVFGAGRGEVMSYEDDPDADFHTYVKETDVTISGGAIIMGSVYGGGENGRVRGNTLVKIQGGQIGCGEGKTQLVDGKYVPMPYTDPQWTGEDPDNFTECPSWDYGEDTNGDDEIDSYNCLPHDPLAGLPYSDGSAVTDGTTTGTDGHTYYGNVFGGGSGYYPYESTEGGVNKHDWLRSAGWVEGNTNVIITGGHILTSVYGGNELTDVGTEGDPTTGKCTVIMTGGTLGVPRIDDKAKAHPVTCYLFGAGKGDQRTHFNTWTNVQNTQVIVSGTARIFGSVFGGGEDGHVLGDAKVDIGTVNIDLNGDGDTTDSGESFTAQSSLKIGTYGTSYVDGNVFGGGRGFSGEALTAGSVRGNVEVNISGGIMLGSVYGGGRLASVGIPFVNATLPNSTTPNPDYGLLINDDITPATYYTAEDEEVINGTKNVGDVKTDAIVNSSHGHVTINISGGTIGNDVENAQYGGNVFGGSMGRNTLLNGDTNPLWPKLAVVKLTEVTISGTAEIKKNVYGGGEFGVVRNMATVNVEGGTILGSVYGGGYGSKDSEPSTTISAAGYDDLYYTFTPMMWNGCVSGNTFVNISGGKINNAVYGGGEMASVGLINFVSDVSGNYTRITKHDNPATDFALSWPYEVEYISAAPSDAPEVGGGQVGGRATVTITGGRIGLKIDDKKGDGDVYGGGKGVAGDRYKYAFCANVKETVVEVKYPSTPDASKKFTVLYDPEESEWQEGITNAVTNDDQFILGSVYGGAENGHVMADTKVTLTNGLIGHAVYGGGKGKTKYTEKIIEWREGPDKDKEIDTQIYSLTAGRVYGNTNVSMTGGHVIRTIYGGGNMASVGKGNYAGGSDDYSTNGYGEKAPAKLWENTYFMSSGKATVEITGGTIGFPNSQKDNLPTGNVFGGCRGTAVPNVPTSLSPRYKYCPEFYAGYVNETEVTIGNSTSGPRIYGSVYGGGQDGHVRRDAKVTINKGEIGVVYDGVSGDIVGDNVAALKDAYGHDSNKTLTADELKKLEDPNHFQWRLRGNVFGGGSGLGMYDTGQKDDNNNKIKKISTAAGSVTNNTIVTVNNSMDGSAGSSTTPGNIIHRNVYGGGSLGTVGPPKIGQTDYAAAGDGTAATRDGTHTLNLVDIQGQVGDATSFGNGYGGNVFGASRGANAEEKVYEESGKAYSTTLFTKVDIDNNAKVLGDVFGGGEMGDVGGSVLVNMKGGVVDHNLYGGGALANTNTYNWNAAANEGAGGWAAGKTSETYTTKVDLLGGTIKNDAYGGGLGTWEDIPAIVYGDVLVELNNNNNGETAVGSKTGCIVNRVFGCNNLNGSPKGKVVVHVHATQHKAKGTIVSKYSPPYYNPDRGKIKLTEDNDRDETMKEYLQRVINAAYELDENEDPILVGGITGSVVTAAEATYADDSATDLEIQTAIDNINQEIANLYDVQVVYGGGNLAEYYPVNADANDDPTKENARAEVHIYGCDLTSIKQVYGGSNAASTPGTYVVVHGTAIIDEVFGGGNGKDNYQVNGKWYENPGANVGYHNYTHYVTTASTPAEIETYGNGDVDKPYKAIENDGTGGYPDASTKDNRLANYSYGAGISSTQVVGGRIYRVYGGSNEKGNIRATALSVYQEAGDCLLNVDETYGGSKNAPIDAEIQQEFECVDYMAQIFGGSTNADVHSNITLTINNGVYHQVFGGNNTSGKIYGTITVNIKEHGCRPIYIDELYGGGYLAGYSIYGYKDDGSPRTKAEYEALSSEEKAKITVQKDPRINIISATKIGEVYGGGYQATVVGNPRVNINMENGYISKKYVDKMEAGSVEPAIPAEAFVGSHSFELNGDTYTYTGLEKVADGRGKLPIGTIDNVFGGGNQANIVGNTYVEIGTGKWVKSWDGDGNPIWETQNADGLVYTYDDADKKWQNSTTTTGSETTTPEANVEVETTTVTTYNREYAYDDEDSEWQYTETKTETVTVNTKNTDTDVTTTTTTGPTTTTTHDHEPTTDPILASRREAFILGNVYGGGKMGDVGDFTKTDGKPTSCATGTGISTVTVSNGEIGKKEGQQMVHYNASGAIQLDGDGNPIPPDDTGHVFGAGMGTNLPADANLTYVDSTEVIINGTAFVKGSVYGGGENGHVLHNTGVKIGGDCQIGDGHILLTDANDKITVNRSIGRRYTSEEWAQGKLLGDADWTSVSLPECASWLYGKEIEDGKVVASTHHAPYDKFANYATGDKGEYATIPEGATSKTTDGGHRIASDGSTFYGMVFGGGSGYFPYAPGKWLNTAGKVEGNTWVVVTGGHILTSLYGGNEMTDVGGHAHVIMKGGTLGVPRTLSEIDAHPVTCYVFGAGKGEGRPMLDHTVNVQETTVDVKGGLVYGSVFGGAEDGHVLGDATVNINESANPPANPTYADYYAGRATKIGTWGTSYVDGNIFGGGRGFDGHNLQAGCIVGNTTINITGGTMLGSIYGGGRLGSVGTYLVTDTTSHDYGVYMPDVGTAATYYTAEEADEYNAAHPSLKPGDADYKTEGDIKAAASLSEKHGYTTINISGGVIGNDLEYVTVPDDVEDLATWKANNHIPKTEFETETVKDGDKTYYIHRLKHAKGGNVFGGSMGRLEKLSKAINPIWPRLGQAKFTQVNISDNALIKGNVYGGSEFGTVNQRTHVNITGGTVNCDVFGGGYGSTDNSQESVSKFQTWEINKWVSYGFTPMQFAGCVGVGTTVDIKGGWVKKIVYGGGEMASVGVPDYKNAVKHDATNDVDAGSPTETFTDFGLSWPYYIPTISGFEGLARVNVTGGRIGLTGKDYMGQVNDLKKPVNANGDELNDTQIDNYEEDNGDIFGGGKGAPGDRYEKAYSANVTRSRVFINLAASTATPENYKDYEDDVRSCIAGSVYGGSESGHVLGDAHVTLVNGLIGHALYGGGKGKETYKGTLNKILLDGVSAGTYETDVYGFTSGKVYGNTYVTMTGGQVMRNIYGGGNMASVGKGNYAGGPDDYFTLGYGEYVTNLWTPSTGYDPSAPITSSNKPATWTLADHFLTSGKTNVKILGGTVGYIDASNPSNTVKDGLPYGNVFGGARGVAVPNINVLPPYKYTPTSYAGYVNETSVTIGTAGQSNEDAGQSGKAPRIYGSVYGGGQDGHVRRDALVVVNSGEIGVPYASDGVIGSPYTSANCNLGGLTVTDSGTGETSDNIQWLHRGNVYGSGSGISKYKFNLNPYDDDDYGDTYTYQGKEVKEEDWSSSAGSVTRFTEVDIKGGIIHRNVYGGGSRASVGPPPNGVHDPYKKDDPDYGPGKQSQNTVIVTGTVGTPTNYNEAYGGEVYGASRGDSESGETYSTSVWTKVHIKNGAVIKGNVFGGGDAGKVKKDTDVIIGD